MARTREERLRLFDRHVTGLVAESGSHATWSVGWNVNSGVATTEPGRESLRSWLLAIRPLDTPKGDIELHTIMDDIEAVAEADLTRQRIAVLRKRRDLANVSRLGDVHGPDGRMTPRQCFEDLAYTDHLHYDSNREARRAAMPQFIWEMVRFIGWDYAGELAEIATWVQAAGREDPATAPLFAPLPDEPQISDPD